MSDPNDLEPDDLDPADQALLDELAAALGPDPVDEGLVTACRALLGVADLDDELTALLVEAAAGAELTGVRGGPAAGASARLTFEAADGEVVVDVRPGDATEQGAAGGGAVRLDVDVLPATAGSVTVEQASGHRRGPFPLDPEGSCRVTGELSGPLRLRVAVTDGPVVVTEWFLL